MDGTIPAAPAPLPRARQPNDPMPTRPGRPRQGESDWSRPARRGPGSALFRLFGVGPDRDACWCVRCTLHRLGVYRRKHVRYGSGAWVRTTVFGVRIRPDRYAFPLGEER